MFKIYLHRTEFKDTVDIYIIDHRADRKITYMTMGEDAIPNIHTVDSGTDIKPFLTLSGLDAKEFFQSMAEALDKEGIKTDSDAKIAGTLEATRYHLEDLRIMLGLNGKDKSIKITKDSVEKSESE